MPICPICDDTGLLNSDSNAPSFCYCSAGKQAKRQWESTQAGNERGKQPRAASFIDVSNLEQVNANVDAMRASLFGVSSSEVEKGTPAKPSSVQLLYRVAHAGHEITTAEAIQLYDLAKALEGFMGSMSSIGRKKGQ